MINEFCKNCGYLWSEHPDGAIDNETYNIVRLMVEPVDKTDCKCLKFYPMDNLGYLEMKVIKDV